MIIIICTKYGCACAWLIPSEAPVSPVPILSSSRSQNLRRRFVHSGDATPESATATACVLTRARGEKRQRG